MDLKIVEGGNKDGENGLDKSDTEEGVKAKDVGSISSKDMLFRADKIDFKSWDVQLEKHLSRVWSRDREAQTKKEVWEIDLAKLDIRSVIAHGTYGTVYRGTYDGQDVAGYSAMPFFPILFSETVTYFISVDCTFCMLSTYVCLIFRLLKAFSRFEL